MSEKKVGKRLLTWVLVLVMTLSLLPLNVLAVNDPETDSSSGMIFTKQLVSDEPDNAGNYTIRMTAQATGKTTTTSEAVPMDIVLVLDVSGSMDDPIPTRFEKIDAKDVTTDKTYYVYAKHSILFGLISWHSYDKVEWCDKCNSFTHNCFDLGFHYSRNKYDPAKDQFYTKIAEIDKIDALKTAVNGFIDQVAQNSADSYIAVVSFASDKANVSDGLLPVKTNVDTLKTAVDNLYAYGATRADLGMEEAARILDSGTNSKKVVVMFTDGEPTSGNKFEKEVANATILAAKGMKDKGTEAFTVGVFDSDPDEKTYEYMNYVSSNYPQAQSMSNYGEGSDKGYYTTADSADSLSKVFEDISQMITKPEPVNDKLDEKTVITDMLSDYFTFAGTAEDVKVYAEKRDGTTYLITDGIDVKGKTVTVTGYDFSAHYKGIGNAEETLFIEIKVKPDTSYTNWGASGKYETNKDNATVTHPNIEEPIAKAASPEVHVDTYKVTYTPGDGSGNEYTDQYYLNGTTRQVKANTFIAQEGYEFDCWKGENDTTYQVGDEITFDKSNVVLTAQWKKSKYTVTYALTDNVKPSNYSVPTDNKKYTKDEEYTVDNTHNEGSKVVDGGYTYTFSGWKLNGTGNVLTGPQTMGNGNVVLKGTWTKTVNKYTVTYKYTGTAPTGAPEVPAAAQHDYDAEVTIENAPTLTGYTFHGWTLPEGLTANGGKFNMPAEPVTITGHWTANTDTKYTVEYYYQNADGSYPATANKTDDRTGTTDATAFVTADDKADKENGKYTYDSTAAANVESGPIAADGSLTLKLYFKLSKFDYTIEYYYEGENEPFDQTTANVTHGTNVSEVNDSSKLAAHYSRKGVDPELPVTIDKAGIVIRVTYAKAPAGDGTFDFNDVVHGGDKATPAITKTVKGNVGKNFKETFAVTVKGADETSNATMSAASYTGKAEVTYSDLKDIAFKFAENDKLTFRDGGNYTYTVREIPGKTSRMSYDTTEYTLKINVVLDADSNTYQVESWQFTAGNREYPTALNIVNTYRTYHPSTPSKPTLNTGDHYAYVMGYPDGTVRPNGSITRAEVSAILFRLLSDETRDEYFTTESSFTDVKAGAWYNNSIATLEKAGVIVDTAKGGAFRPNEAITRAELAVMLAQFSDAKPVKGVKFSDVSAEHWAYEAIAIAAKMGWIEGYPDGTFRPDATITRAEMMTLVNRALERVPSDEDHLLSKRVMLTFPDCKSGDWFYIAVQEATNSHTYERAATEKNGDEQWTALRANRDWTQLEK